MINETLKLELKQKTYICVDGVEFPLDHYQLKSLFQKVFSGVFDDMNIKELRESL